MQSTGTCPNCAAKIRIHEERVVGQPRRCPSCKRVFTVQPDHAEVVAEIVAEPRNDPLPFAELERISLPKAEGEPQQVPMATLVQEFANGNQSHAATPDRPTKIAGISWFRVLGVSGVAAVMLVSAGIAFLIVDDQLSNPSTSEIYTDPRGRIRSESFEDEAALQFIKWLSYEESFNELPYAEREKMFDEAVRWSRMSWDQVKRESVANGISPNRVVNSQEFWVVCQTIGPKYIESRR